MSEKDRDSLTLAVAGKIFSCAVFNELAQAIIPIGFTSLISILTRPSYPL